MGGVTERKRKERGKKVQVQSVESSVDRAGLRRNRSGVSLKEASSDVVQVNTVVTCQ